MEHKIFDRMAILCFVVMSTSAVVASRNRVVNSKCDPETTVKLQQGFASGLRRKVSPFNRDINVYYGIRFGLKPSGRQRFSKAKPAPPISGHDCFDRKAANCLQVKDTSYQNNVAAKLWVPKEELSEDCLFLNIYVPVQRHKEKKKLTVMFWIYGGGFFSGTPNLYVYEGSYLAASQNVIVVSTNYRLGPFGFLYLRHPLFPGNMGLWDQRLALKWVNENIAAFGGDPKHITIFGESAGAVSVSAHLISPWSHNYFENAIMQSGSLQGYWGLSGKRSAMQRSINVLKKLHCHKRSLESTINCMAKIPAKKIAESLNAILDKNTYFSVPMHPVMDNYFFPYVSSSDLKKMHHLKPSGSLMLGINKNEGSYWLLYAFIPNEAWLRNITEIRIMNRTDYLEKLKMVLDAGGEDSNVDESLLNYLDFEYTDVTAPVTQKHLVERLELISSDRTFKCPTIDMANLVIDPDRARAPLTKWFNRYKRGRAAPPLKRISTLPTYFYEFRYRTETLPWPQWMGSIHGLEIEYIFGMPFSNKYQLDYYTFTDKERELSYAMMTYWANFAKTGDPNLNEYGEHVSYARSGYLPRRGRSIKEWPAFNNITETFLVFNEAANLTISYRPMKRKCAFWKSLYPILRNELRTDSPKDELSSTSNFC